LRIAKTETMPADTTLDLVILDSGTKDNLAVYARCGHDTACAPVSPSKELTELFTLQERFKQSIDGTGLELTAEELKNFGEKLFLAVIRDSVAKLFDTLPTNASIRLLILSNHEIVQTLPWELMQQPHAVPAPDPNRIIVRIVPTIGIQPLEPLKRSDRLRVLFAVAEPLDQPGTDWNETYVLLLSKFGPRVDKSRIELSFLRATSRESLFDQLKKPYDVLHFYGHGEAIDGVGNLAFVSDASSSGQAVTDFVPGPELVRLLARTPIRLAILSACNSAVGSFRNDFSVLAKGLVAAGMRAVVASQSRVSVATVALFAPVLYDKLLETGDIDEAVSYARAKLAFVADYSNDWAAPVLYRHIAAAAVLA
jgi:hypothetical protein